MSNHFNDSPIETPEDDLYGVVPFAQSMAKSIRSIEKPVGTAIALNGSWGSGKSSIVNLIRRELESANDQKLAVSEFKCWWYRGEEALALAFLQHLNVLLNDTFKGKAKKLIPNIAQKLLPIGLIGSSVMAANPSTAPIGAGLSVMTRRLDKFLKNNNTIEKTFKKLTKILENEERQVLIIIDDIDRLNAEEAIAIFRMIKSIGRLPNVLYLLVFDRILIEEMVLKIYSSEGPHFLEKIIQASFEIPYPLQIDINNTVLSYIEQILESPNIKNNQRFMNMFYDIVVSYLTTPRDVVKFKNMLSVTWPAIVNQINVTDFIILEITRLYESKLFQNIRTNKLSLCGVKSKFQRIQGLSRQDTQAPDDLLAIYLVGVDKAHLPIARRILKGLFPRVRNENYNSDYEYDWNANRRVCVEAHFDTYFRSSLSDENPGTSDIEELISKADDAEFIKSKFYFARTQRRRTGGSMVPVWLDILISHASSIQKQKVKLLLSTLFEIHDEIDIDIDFESEALGLASVSQQYHILIWKLTHGRFTSEERMNIYISALANTCIGWLIDFTFVSQLQHRRDIHRVEGDTFLFEKDIVDQLIDRALSAIRKAAVDKSLLKHKRLRSIFQAWHTFLDDDISEIRDWTDELLNNDEALVILVKQFSGETLQVSGPNDNVGTREPHIKINEMQNIIDLDYFYSRLQHLQCTEKLNNNDQKAVDLFLELWGRR